MSGDAELSHGQNISTDDKFPEVGNSAIACENASGDDAVALTKETLNCPVEKGQKELCTVSAVTGMEEMSGKSAGSDKSNEDEQLSRESAEAAKAENGNCEDKVQCDQSQNTACVDSTGQEPPLIVTQINGINEINGDVKLVPDGNADAKELECNGHRAPSSVAEIKPVEEMKGECNGLRKDDESFDADKADVTSSMATNPVAETTVMEEMRGESGGPRTSNDGGRLSEESVGDEKEDSSCQRAPQVAMDMTEMEQIECLSSCVQNSSEDKSQSENAENEVSNGQEAPGMDLNVKGINDIGGDSNGDAKLECEESAGTEKVVSNCEKAPSTATEISTIEDLRLESNGSTKIDESVDSEKASSNDSVVTDIVTEVNGSEGESNAADKMNTVKEITGIDVESNGADISDDKLESQESTITETEDSEIQKSEVVSEFNGVEKVNAVKGIPGVEVESNGPKEVSDDKLEYQESTTTETADANSQKANVVGESNGADKMNTVKEITGIEDESVSAEEISVHKLENQESTVTETADDESKKSNVVGEINGTEEIEGGSGGTDKRTDGNSTCEERKDAEAPNSSSPVHKEVPRDAEFFVDQSALDDVNLCEAANSSSSSTKGVSCDAVRGNTLSDPVHDCKMVPDTAIAFTAIKKEEDGSSVADQTNVDKLVPESEDGEKSLSINIGERVPRDAEFYVDQSALDDVNLCKAANSSSSGTKDVSCDVVHGNTLSDPVHDCKMVPDTATTFTAIKKEEDDSTVADQINVDKFVPESEDAEKSLSINIGERVPRDAEFSVDQSALDDVNFCKAANSSSSSTKDMSCDVVHGTTLSDPVHDCKMVPDTVTTFTAIKKEEDDSSVADQTNADKFVPESEGAEKSLSINAGERVPRDAEFSVNQSALDDVNLCKAANSSSSSTKDVSCDVVHGNTLSDPVHDGKMVPDTATTFTAIKREEDDSSVADKTNVDKLVPESEDAEKSLSINISERTPCNAEICHDQATLADLELAEAGNTSVSRGKDVSSNDALTFESEAMISPNKIDLDSAKVAIEIAGTEETGGGSDRSNDDKLTCEQSADAKISNTSDVLTPSAECSAVDTVAVKDINGSAAKGFYFLIRIPRFDDEKLRERIRAAELNVDEKTQHRDAFRQKIRNKRATCQTHGAEFEAAKTHEREARKQVRMKRADISALQDVIDKAKNAIAIDEIDARICNMEHIIGHETLPLKEEKLLIREIKQLKQLRGQLSSNSGSMDGVQKALDERGVNEERLKILKKELDSLKLNVSKAETIAVAASRKYEDESKKLKELQEQFKAADDIRQEAYEELRNLKKGLYEKNIHFRTYKDEATLAGDYARKREMEALHSLCVNQVETQMELWNKNDEYRKDYIRCNTRSTVRRFGTLDGRTLGPDEAPIILPSYVERRVDRAVATVEKVDSVLQSPVPQQEKQAVVVKDQIKDDKIKVQAAERKVQIEKTKEAQKPIQIEEKKSVVDDEAKEVEHQQTAKELEAARKEEELRKLEAEAKLKEQRRLEEIAKAKEALERKRRNAEKAQQRAELRAQKEEEQKLKEKEKRLRKKERKRAGETQSETNDAETALISASPREAVKELEATENPQTTTAKKTQKPSHYTKQIKTKSSAIPPPLRNRNRRKLQQWLWVALSCVIVIALFFLGNIGFFSNLKPRRNPAF